MNICAPGKDGFRRLDSYAIATREVGRKYAEQAARIEKARALSVIKQVGRLLGLTDRELALLDYLMGTCTKPRDWMDGVLIVWPGNRQIAAYLGVTVRTVQKLLRELVMRGLVSHVDSPNGQRYGRRGSDGQIILAYGIDLSPLAARIEEFEQIVARHKAEEAIRKETKNRITVLGRMIRSVARSAIAQGVAGMDWEAECELARMAAEQAKRVEDLVALQRIVEQLEERLRRMEMAVLQTAERAVDNAPESVLEKHNDSPMGENSDVPYRTTNEQIPYGVTSRGSAGMSSGEIDARSPIHEAVETDLEKYGVTPAMIGRSSETVRYLMDYGEATWERTISIAEAVAEQWRISPSAKREAFRILGPKGAAAAIIATIHKASEQTVREPGAYLRGTVRKALTGELSLGRTFRGIAETKIH